MRQSSSKAVSWQSLGLTEETQKLVKKAGFHTPTPVQEQSIPIALDGHDLVVSSQTGSGKTAGFCLPMIELLIGRKGTFGLVLCPTREIAQQTHETIKAFGAPQGVRSVVLIGGSRVADDVEALRSGPEILVGTPGRICDHLDRGSLWLEYIEILVLDEADRMLDMGFAKELSRITDQLGEDRQTLLFSATIPPVIDKLAKKILFHPKRVTIGKPQGAPKSVKQEFFWVNEDTKKRELMKLIREEKGTMIVFAPTKDEVFRLWRSTLDHKMEDTTYINSNIRQMDREKALQGFKDGKFRVLFATDVVGRGIHVDNVEHIVNYGLPREVNDYIHRIGRTGRKDATGRATSLVTGRDRGQVRRIEALLKISIPDRMAEDYDPDSRPRENRGRRQFSGRGKRKPSKRTTSRRPSNRGRRRPNKRSR